MSILNPNVTGYYQRCIRKGRKCHANWARLHRVIKIPEQPYRIGKDPAGPIHTEYCMVKNARAGKRREYWAKQEVKWSERMQYITKYWQLAEAAGEITFTRVSPEQFKKEYP